jgi:hypothetical protein
MKAKVLAAVAALCVAGGAFAHDPVVTDGDKYKVLLENDRVRVLAYTDRATARSSTSTRRSSSTRWRRSSGAWCWPTGAGWSGSSRPAT